MAQGQRAAGKSDNLRGRQGLHESFWFSTIRSSFLAWGHHPGMPPLHVVLPTRASPRGLISSSGSALALFTGPSGCPLLCPSCGGTSILPKASSTSSEPHSQPCSAEEAALRKGETEFLCGRNKGGPLPQVHFVIFR